MEISSELVYCVTWKLAHKMHSNVKRIKEKINFGGQTIRLETDKEVFQMARE